MQQDKLQTIAQFMAMPLNIQKSSNKQSEYNIKYEQFKRHNKIRIEGYTVIGVTHFIHIIIPSDSSNNRSYDVIIKLIPAEGAERNTTMINYYIQFFSNSPGFIYKYAVLYKEHGLLIEELYNKMDPQYMDKLPEKANATLELSYDKSIYFACKFLSENKFKYMSKIGPLILKKKSPEKFFDDIVSFRKMKILQEFEGLEKRVNRSYAKERLGDKLKTADSKKRKTRSNVKTAQKHTSGLEMSATKHTKKIQPNKKITGTGKLPKR